MMISNTLFGKESVCKPCSRILLGPSTANIGEEPIPQKGLSKITPPLLNYIGIVSQIRCMNCIWLIYILKTVCRSEKPPTGHFYAGKQNDFCYNTRKTVAYLLVIFKNSH
jgi:hypothetical protein